LDIERPRAQRRVDRFSPDAFFVQVEQAQVGIEGARGALLALRFVKIIFSRARRVGLQLFCCAGLRLDPLRLVAHRLGHLVAQMLGQLLIEIRWLHVVRVAGIRPQLVSYIAHVYVPFPGATAGAMSRVIRVSGSAKTYLSKSTMPPDTARLRIGEPAPLGVLLVAESRQWKL
jgi:hypothetical protein